MNNRTRNIIYSLILFASIFAVGIYRRNKASEAANSPDLEKISIEGNTMGTTYHITYFDPHHRNFKNAVDSLLKVVNQSINNYDPSSEVSAFNRSPRGVKVQLPYLVPPLKTAQEVYKASAGAFDMTVMPLVNAWGFGPGKKRKLSAQQIDSVRQFIGFSKVTVTEDSITKIHPNVQLDFGGIGQGYGADVITDFLLSKGIQNMLVELGGEGHAVGKNLKTGKPWEIGILDPNSTYENQFFKAYVSLSGKAFTTSGNYFNYHIEDGVKYSHTIDPVTAAPSKKPILSASVFAENCALADAWGTALMVSGHEEAIRLSAEHPEIDVLLMYSGDDGKVKVYISPGIKPSIQLEDSPQP